MKRKAALFAVLFCFFSTAFMISAGAEDNSGVSALHQTVETQKESSGSGHEVNAHENMGKTLPIWSILPFVGILLSIALFPLFAHKFWEKHYIKVSLLWAVVTIIPMLVAYREAALLEFLTVFIADYIPFIILLFGLFTVSGGILLKGSLRGTPVVNTIILVIGTILASVMGTTGASMLLIRPLLRANDYRKNKAFIVVFFIFLVSNIGGSLTPVGDPPLFLGFLHGVPFLWTLKIIPQMITASVLVLVIYFMLDSYYYKKENSSLPSEGIRIALEGKLNFVYLLIIIGSVILSGLVNLGEINILGVKRELQTWIRDAVIILTAVLSLKSTRKDVREANGFSWGPIKEVAFLFIGIFMTMMPCLMILKAGSEGALAFVINSIKEPWHYFWITGALSSFLDNAPTYLTFFNTALGRFYPGIPEAQAVPQFIAQNAVFLKAISAGAVFFGANSYIGNAPNFMVRSIAEEAGVKMPSFFGYIFKYSLLILIPVYIVVTLIFF